MVPQTSERPWSRWRGALHQIIFEADTSAGKAFDVGLVWSVILSVATVVIIIGSVMYAVEGEEHGFSDIPTSIYWAIVTMTTVGYGDISPQTALGKALASLVMILGYGIIAVPTGIVTVEMSQASRRGVSRQACQACGAEGHDLDAVHCKYCGVRL
jgi:voltage-gated potassium channel